MGFSVFPQIATVLGTANQINVTHPTGSTIQLALPQSIAPQNDVTFASVNGVTLTPQPTGILIGHGGGGNILTVASDGITISGHPDSTIDIGTGGALGTNAFSSTPFVPASRTINGIDLTGNVTLTPSNLGASTIGANLFTLTNPSAVSYLKVNADNTIAARTAAQIKTDLSLTVGTNIQAWNANLDSLATASTTNSLYYRNGSGAWVPVSIGGNISFSGGTLDAASGGGGTVTVSGTPSTGNLAVFSSALVVTNANLSGDITTAGSTTTTLANIPDGVPLSGSILGTNVVAPSTPASGKTKIYIDSTSKNLSSKNDAGVVTHGVQTATATTSNWIRGIADNGAVTLSQPTFSDVSGIASNGQIPATLASKTFDNTNTITVKSGNLTVQDSSDTTKQAIFGLSNIGTGVTRTINVPNANSTTVQSNVGSSSNWVTGISAQGVVSISQPAFSDISGVSSNAQMPPIFIGKTIDNTNTITVKSGNLTVQDTTDATKQAIFGLSNIGTGTTRTVNVPNANSTTVQASTLSSSNYVTGITAQGVLTGAQPAFSDISGGLVNGQLPSTISSKTFDNTNVYAAKDGSFTLENTTTGSKKAVFDLSNIGAAATRTINVPNANSTTVQPNTGTSNNFLTAISAQGVVSTAQPAFSNISGTIDAAGAQLTGVLAVGRMPAFLGDVTSSSGGVTTTLANIPTAVTAAGYIAFTAIAAPGTPGTGVGRIYVDSTSKNMSIKDDAGVVKHGVQTQAAIGSNWIRSISDAGVVTTSQPAFSDVSGIASNGQVPVTLSSKTFDNSNTYAVKDGSFTIENTTTGTKKAVFDLSNVGAVQTRTINVPNANSTLVQANTGSSNNFLTAISAQGVVSTAQPTFSNLSGSAVAGQMPAFTGDISTSAGSTVTTLGNIPTATPAAGYISFTAIAAPGTPSAGLGRLYVDSTSKNFAMKNDAGTVLHGVQTQAAVGSNWIRAISDGGAITTSQPAFSDVSGTAVNGQIPSTLSSKTLDNTNTLNIKDGSFTLENTTTGTKKAVFDLSNIGAVQTRTINIPNADSTTVQGGSVVSTQYVTGISTQGVITRAQPTFSDVSGAATNGQLPSTLSSKTLDNTNVITVKSGNLIVQDTTDVTKQASFDLTSITTGNTRSVKVANGASVTVIPDAGASNNFLTGISSVGAVTRAQPAFSNISGIATNSQLPSAISSKVLDNTNEIHVVDGSIFIEKSGDPSATVSFDLTNITGGAARVIRPADGNSVTVNADAGASNNFLTGISSTGNITKAQPAFTNISGTATDAQIPNLLTLTEIDDTNGNKLVTFTANASAVNYLDISNATSGAPTVNLSAVGASSSINIKVQAVGAAGVASLHNTLGDLSLIANGNVTIDNALTVGFAGTSNIPLKLVGQAITNGTAQFDISNIAASTTRTVNIPNANSTTVQPNTGTTSKFLTAISAQGVVSNAQPAFTDVSGTATVAQGGTGSGTAAGARANLFTLSGNAGKTLIVNGTGSDLVTTLMYRKVNVVIITANGTYTPTTGATELFVELCAAGGGGAGALGSAVTASVGGGGGAGGSASTWVTTPSGSYSVTVGTGGAGGVGNANGSGGGDTLFGSVAQAQGGGGGSTLVSGSSLAFAGFGGGGGGVAGDIIISGSGGTSGIRFNAAVCRAGNGGSCGIFGGSPTGIATEGNGNTMHGIGYGSGGAGAVSLSTTSKTGGQGANGIIRVTEYITTSTPDPGAGA